jgi:hypothetical protein
MKKRNICLSAFIVLTALPSSPKSSRWYRK